MQTSGFITNLSEDKIETLGINGATSITYKGRINGKLYFIKRLRPEYLNNSQYRKAFEKEFEVGKLINSPHVTKYVSIHEDAEGCYILMEYINGLTLEEKLATEPEYFQTHKHVSKLVEQLSAALLVLHQNNIIHLDIKPENILITKTSNDVVLVDLGCCISNCYDDTAGYTPSFAAPETLAKDIKNIDARSDIYSIGRLLDYIEQKSGTYLSSTCNRIKHKCLQEEKSKRYSSTNEILQSLSPVNSYITIAACVLILMACGLGFKYTVFYDDICDRIAWKRGIVPDRFEVDGIFYHITNDDAATVEVTFKGNHPDEFEYEYKGGEVLVPQEVTYRGRTFKVTAFAGRAFNTPYVSKVTIPEGIEVIADSAFIYCNQHGVITIPKSVKKIGVSAFYPMLYIDSLVVDDENPYYDSRGNCNAIIETSTNTLLAGCKNTMMPDDVEHIAPNAFVGAEDLKHITLPKSLKQIGEAAFVHCGIEEIVIPEGIQKLEYYTFQYCENLQKVTLPQSLVTIDHAALSHCGFKSIVIPDAVTTIGDYAFDYCKFLETVEIGSGVQSIGHAAFDGCQKLKKVISHIPADSLFAVDSSTWRNISPTCVLYVPRGAKTAYEQTFGWNAFHRIVEF